MKHGPQLIPLFLLAALVASQPAAAARKPVRVFILAGQSNLEGAGVIKADPRRNGGKGSLEFLVKDAATAMRFAPLVNSAGQWRTRDDVWVSYLDRKGPLTVGFGARRDETIGPELGVGWVPGDALDEPVFLMKMSLAPRAEFAGPWEAVATTIAPSRRRIDGGIIRGRVGLGACP
jgi:alpha-galactosidase